MAVYTRNGDLGKTGLFSGQKVPKSHPVIEFIGKLDELNSYIGICIAGLEQIPRIDFTDDIEVLADIQNDLFAVSAIASGAKLPFDAHTEVKNIEETIDDYEKFLPQLKSFVTPGGSVSAANLYYVRAMTRSIERYVASLKSNSITPFVSYLNRLSDLFFVMARYVNKKTEYPEEYWKG